MLTPFLQDADVTLYQGDVLEVLRGLPDESVHMACTSPPFYGLRDYRTGSWEGGDEGCNHRKKDPATAARKSTLGPNGDGLGPENQAHQTGATFTDTCGKCGARRVDQQIGLEATPDLWVARLVEVFREVRRVLRGDGSLWLELGDSYAGGGGYAPDAPINQRRQAGDLDGNFRVPKLEAREARKGTGQVAGCKSKDMVGAPWLLAFALRADGWYLRSEIIWAKPNPMPESVSDRPTVSHSRVFLLTKSARYFYDAEAIREPNVSPEQGEHNARYAKHYDLAVVEAGQNGSESIHSRGNAAGRNRRSVWTIPTQPYPEAHFATWPEKLVEPMILAGTSERGVCPECGAPWERVIERGELRPVRGEYLGSIEGDYKKDGSAEVVYKAGKTMVRTSEGWSLLKRDTTTTGWQPTCGHNGEGETGWLPPEPIPATVLDPFAGSGTTLHVARRLGRHSIGIELNPDYCQLAARRLAQQSLLV